MSAQLGQLAVVHWALIAGNNAYALDRMYNELHDADIHNVVGELREIQSHLNDLDLWFQDQRITRLMPREMRDMGTGISACSTSLGRLDEIVKTVTSIRRGEPTSRVWGEIRAKFKEMEGPIFERLNAHRVWLTQLFPILKMHFIFSKPQNRMELERLHNQIRYVNGIDDEAIREQRLKEWEEYCRRVAEQHRMATRYEQPPSPQYSPTGFVPMTVWAPQSNPNPTHPGPPHVYTGPTGPGGFYPSPPNSNSSNNSPQTARPGFTIYYSTPPQIAAGPSRLPGPPSPTTQSPPRRRSMSRPGHRRQQSEGGYNDHRWEREERRPHSEDGSSWSGSDDFPKSQWFGRAIDAYNISTAENEQEVMMAEFYPNMSVYLYRNEETDASRIVCKFTGVGTWINDQRGGQRPYQGSIKVNALTICREATYILNLKRNRHLWARLVFTDFENMVIFWNVFIALRTYSPSQEPISITSEKWMKKEESLWSATIQYDRDPYKLHLLRDSDTGAIRIAAIDTSTGKKNMMTIWTAFLHHRMDRGVKWCRRESCTVFLDRTTVHFFSKMYRVKMKDLALQFLNSQDAISFCEAIEDLSHDMQMSSRRN